MIHCRVIVLFLLVAVVILAVNADPAWAQCAMCKASMEASSDAATLAKGFNLAALVLLIPPVSIFTGMFAVIYRFRNIQGSEHERREVEAL